MPAEEIVGSIDEEVDFSTSAQADVEEFAYSVAAEHDPANIPDGMEPDIVENVELSNASVNITEDSSDGSLIVESETLLKKTYENGVVSEGLIETITVFDADGEIASFKELTLEDYANQINVDSNTTTNPYDEDPASSEFGETL